MYLIRHGATANNVADPPVLQGCNVDAPLSPEGEAQANAVAQWLSHRAVGSVYASPLIRAQATAARIALPHHLPVQVVPLLREVDVGHWEGRSWVHIAQEEPEAYAQFQSQPDLFGYAGGENLTQVRDRVLPVLTELLQTATQKPIIVVAHNVVNRVYLAHLLKIPLSEARSIPQHNCGVNVIRWHRHAAVVETLNSTFHLDAIASS